MTSESEALSKKLDRVTKSIERFPSAASSLSTATDQLGKSISQLELVLKKFSLGIPTWVSFNGNPAGFPSYAHEDLGYAKIGGKWGIAVRTVSGDIRAEEEERVEQWLFAFAPRFLQLQAVEKIPDLLEALLDSAAQMSKKMTDKAEEVNTLAAGMGAVIDQPKPSNLAGLSPASAPDPAMVGVATYSKRANEEVATQIASGRYRGGLADAKARK